MLEDQIVQLRSLLNQAGDLPDATRNEILSILSDVEAGRAGVKQESPAPADDVPAVTHTARALGRLAGAADLLEASHPTITATINNIATALARIGV